MKIINIGKDFSNNPSGRYRKDSDNSGVRFREEILIPKLNSLKEGEKVVIILDDGVEGYGSSFLVEGFAGVVKNGHFNNEELLNKLDIQYQDDDYNFYKNKIIKYIKEAVTEQKLHQDK